MEKHFPRLTESGGIYPHPSPGLTAMLLIHVACHGSSGDIMFQQSSQQDLLRTHQHDGIGTCNPEFSIVSEKTTSGVKMISPSLMDFHSYFQLNI